jgi:hypothetical protein
MPGMTWKGLEDLGLSLVLSKVAVLIFYAFCLLAFSRFIFLKVDCINGYFNDKTNSFNIILNYISAHRNGTIIALSIILTTLTSFKFKIKFNIGDMITIFIFMFALLILLTKLFFNI